MKQNEIKIHVAGHIFVAYLKEKKKDLNLKKKKKERNPNQERAETGQTDVAWGCRYGWVSSACPPCI